MKNVLKKLQRSHAGMLPNRFLYASAPGGYTMYWAAVIGVIIFSAYLTNGLIPQRFPDVSQQKIVALYWKKYGISRPVLQLGALFTKNAANEISSSPDTSETPENLSDPPSATATPTNTPTPTPTPLPHVDAFKPPADIILVIDTSHSMQGTKLNHAKAAAKSFIDIVKQNAQMRVGVATFDSRHGRVIQALTNSYDTVKNQIQGLSADDEIGTCLECAIDDSQNQSDVRGQFQNNGVNPKKVVIILTDGNINRYVKNQGQDRGKVVGSQNGADEQKARDQARLAIAGVSNRFDAQFWVVHYGGGSHASYLQNIVQSYNGQGQYYSATPEVFTLIYNGIADQITFQ